jgi:hypothetical protein
MSSDDSGKPLVQKLGIKEGHKVAILDAPESYNATLGKLPDRVIMSRKLRGRLDLVQIFVKDKADLEKEFLASKMNIKPTGAIWVSWPKRSSGLGTDLSESAVRDIGLKNGLVDVKICAIDQTWSALKFVIRVRDRQ